MPVADRDQWELADQALAVAACMEECDEINGPFSCRAIGKGCPVEMAKANAEPPRRIVFSTEFVQAARVISGIRNWRPKRG